MDALLAARRASHRIEVRAGGIHPLVGFRGRDPAEGSQPLH
jgi:hypothetical protein